MPWLSCRIKDIQLDNKEILVILQVKNGRISRYRNVHIRNVKKLDERFVKNRANYKYKIVYILNKLFSV